MNENMHFVILFMISFLIDQSFSAILWNFHTSEFQQEYDDKRQESVHRGVLLSYSAEEKNDICKDVYSAQLYYKNDPEDGEPIITDGKTVDEGLPQHRLTVREISTLTSETRTKEIFFKCVGDNFATVDRLSNYVSTAFRSGWFYMSKISKSKQGIRMIPEYFTGISPQLIDMSENDIEVQYAEIRQTIEMLKEESPKYVELIEKKADIWELEEWKQRLLCASILSSPIYRDERLEPFKDWIDGYGSVEQEVTFSFRNDFAKKGWMANSIVCKGTEDLLNDPHTSIITDLYLTASYDNKNSVYVSKVEQNNIYLSKYFVNAPILINAKARIIDTRYMEPREYESFLKQFFS